MHSHPKWRPCMNQACHMRVPWPERSNHFHKGIMTGSATRHENTFAHKIVSDIWLPPNRNTNADRKFIGLIIFILHDSIARDYLYIRIVPKTRWQWATVMHRASYTVTCIYIFICGLRPHLTTTRTPLIGSVYYLIKLVMIVGCSLQRIARRWACSSHTISCFYELAHLHEEHIPQIAVVEQ